jgi:hypothetical protein
MTNFIDWLGNPGNASFATSVLSLISIVVASIAMYTSWRTQKRLVEIEEVRERDRQKEMRKADLAARLKDDDSRDLLVIENKGPAEAREIVILLNGKPLSEYEGFVGDQKEIRKVGPYSSFHYLMVLCCGMELSFEITITWKDDSGEPGLYQTTLTY